MVSEDEARNTVELDDMFVIKPLFPWWSSEHWDMGRPVPDGFRYASDTNTQWLGPDDLKAMVKAP